MPVKCPAKHILSSNLPKGKQDPQKLWKCDNNAKLMLQKKRIQHWTVSLYLTILTHTHTHACWKSLRSHTYPAFQVCTLRLIVKEKWFSHQCKVASFSKSAPHRMPNYFHKQRFSCFDLIVNRQKNCDSAFNYLFLMKKGRNLIGCTSHPQRGNSIDWKTVIHGYIFECERRVMQCGWQGVLYLVKITASQSE